MYITMFVSSHCFVAFAIQLHCVSSILLEVEKGIIQVTEHSFDISRIFGGSYMILVQLFYDEDMVPVTG